MEIAKILDIETVPDMALIGDVFQEQYFDDNPSIPSYDHKHFMEYVNSQVGEGVKKDFLPLIFHRPVAIAVGSAQADGSLVGPMCMDPGLDNYFHINPSNPVSVKLVKEPGSETLVEGELAYTNALVRMFWEKCREWRTPLITYNGRGFDLPVLEMWALRLGLDCNFYYKDSKNTYRHKYGRHIDLLDHMQNFGAVRRVGKLDWLLKAIGETGKGEVDGTSVDKMWADGKHKEVQSYCCDDVTQTHAFFERWRKVTGII